MINYTCGIGSIGNILLLAESSARATQETKAQKDTALMQQWKINAELKV